MDKKKLHKFADNLLIGAVAGVIITAGAMVGELTGGAVEQIISPTISASELYKTPEPNATFSVGAPPTPAPNVITRHLRARPLAQEFGTLGAIAGGIVAAVGASAFGAALFARRLRRKVIKVPARETTELYTRKPLAPVTTQEPIVLKPIWKCNYKSFAKTHVPAPTPEPAPKQYTQNRTAQEIKHQLLFREIDWAKEQETKRNTIRQLHKDKVIKIIKAKSNNRHLFYD
jgi:hypothetical protein